MANLYSRVIPFTKFLNFNIELSGVGREEISNEIKEDTIQIHNKFYRCPYCIKVY